MRRWFERLKRKWMPPLPPPPIRALAKPVPPVKLERVFPPLPAADFQLSLQKENTFSETEIDAALELLRGGGGQRGTTRVTRPARFKLAMRQVQGFADNCLMAQAGSRVPVQDMYAGYLLWAADNRQHPIPNSDFDVAMSDYLASVGGIRSIKGYNGCRFRPDYVRRLDAMNSQEAKRRLGMGLEELMAGKRPSE